jgi:hypothetical protein
MCSAKSKEYFDMEFANFIGIHQLGTTLVNKLCLKVERERRQTEGDNDKRGDEASEKDNEDTNKREADTGGEDKREEEDGVPMWEPWSRGMVLEDKCPDTNLDTKLHTWTFRLPYNPPEWQNPPHCIKVYRALHDEYRKLCDLRRRRRSIPEERIHHLNRGVALLGPFLDYLVTVSLAQKDTIHEKTSKQMKEAIREGKDLGKCLKNVVKRFESNILTVLEENLRLHESMHSKNQCEEGRGTCEKSHGIQKRMMGINNMEDCEDGNNKEGNY